MVPTDSNVHIVSYLVSSAYQVEIVFLKEFSYNLLPKCVGNTSIVFTPTGSILPQIYSQYSVFIL